MPTLSVLLKTVVKQDPTLFDLNMIFKKLTSTKSEWRQRLELYNLLLTHKEQYTHDHTQKELLNSF